MTPQEIWPMTVEDLQDFEDGLFNSFFLEEAYEPIFSGDDTDKILSFIEELL